MIANSIPSSRVFLGKIGALTKADLYKEASKHGTILDFLLKDQYAFVVLIYPLTELGILL